MDAIYDLAKYIVNTRYEDIPQNVVKIAKKFIIDSIGVGMAGSSAPGNAEIMDLIKEWGGKKESSILVYGTKVPAPFAAFANSILIHSNDYDDTHDQTATHANVTALPAALSIAEKMGVTGKELITAVILGVDLTCRLALASNLFHGWHNTATVGVFGATAAAGKILGLGQEQMVNAMGIAYSQAAGNRQGRQDGALTKRLQPAFSTKAGVTSAIFAQRGVTGAKNVIQGEWGFFRLYHDPSRKFEPDKWANVLKDGLGERFEVANLGTKPYPCVRCSHASIDGALDLAIHQNIKAGEIEEVTIYTNQRVIDTAGGPFKIRTDPLVDAQFSIPYTIATALIRKKINLDTFEEKTIRDREIGKLAAKVKVVLDPEFEQSVAVEGPIRIRIKMRDGKEMDHRVEIARGHPQNPLNEQELSEKFRDCLKHAVKPIPHQKIEKILSMLMELEEANNIAQVVRLINA
ncbi:MAG: MmgE/PrpD family protein [Thermodesulfobacteriota bacterium]|nr:MmgE/PrpD family protein [Thermodesulfobacteriota bacterium]